MKNKPLLTIFAIVFVDLLGFGIILPLLPYIAEKYHATATQIGLLTAAYSFFQLVASPILGKLSDRYGRKKILMISQFGSAIGYLMLAFSNNLPLLFVSRIIDGITGGNISIAQAYIADVTTKENRAKGMGMIGAAFGLGFIFGPAIGGFLSQFGYMYPALFAMVVGLITVLLTHLFLPETVNIKEREHIAPTPFSLIEIKKVLIKSGIGYLIVIFLLLNTSFSLFTGIFALWTQKKFGFGATENGYFFAYIGILSVIAQLKVLPYLATRFKENKLLAYSTFYLFLGLFFLPFVTRWEYLLFTQLFIVSGNSIANPSIQALASENVQKEEYGETLGFLSSAGSVGRIIGPIIGGELFDYWGINSPFFFGSLIILIVFVYLQVRLRRKLPLL